MTQHILVLGATSAIALATVRIWAAKGCRIHLVARDVDKLDATLKDLEIRGTGTISTECLEFCELEKHGDVIERAFHQLGRIDIVLIAHGTLPNQLDCESKWQSAHQELLVNFTSTALLLTHLASQMERQGSGTIAVITSVAGDRGRKSNYVYGSAKAGINTWLDGLRHRLAGKGVHVLTIKPGFVATPMTAHLKQGPLFAQPETIANGIIKAIKKRKRVVYLPWFWKWIMTVIRMVPTTIFHKTNL